MKFRIKKEVSQLGVNYWTEPSNMILRFWHRFPTVDIFYEQPAWDCWNTKQEAQQHIKRWNNGYYKRKYYSKFV